MNNRELIEMDAAKRQRDHGRVRGKDSPPTGSRSGFQPRICLTVAAMPTSCEVVGIGYTA